jgi:hypothetical protein
MPHRIKDMAKEYYQVFNRLSGSFTQSKKESGFSVSHTFHNIYKVSPRVEHMKISSVWSSDGWRKCAEGGTVVLVIAIIITVLVTGCTLPGTGSSSTGHVPATVARTPWAGSWDSDWGIMEFTQTGDKVIGTYTHDNGKIEGSVSGNTLTGTWSESPTYKPPKDAGDFVITLAADEKSFTGNWRYGSGSGKWDGGWDAKKK